MRLIFSLNFCIIFWKCIFRYSYKIIHYYVKPWKVRMSFGAFQLSCQKGSAIRCHVYMHSMVYSINHRKRVNKISIPFSALATRGDEIKMNWKVGTMIRFYIFLVHIIWILINFVMLKTFCSNFVFTLVAYWWQGQLFCLEFYYCKFFDPKQSTLLPITYINF